VDIGVDNIDDRHRPFGAQHASERDRAAQFPGQIDYEDVVEIVRQVGCFAAVVDHLAHGPAIGDLDQRALHHAASGILRIRKRALDLGPLLGGKLGKNVLTLLLGQVFQEGGGVVGLEFARRGGDLLAVELVENVLQLLSTIKSFLNLYQYEYSAAMRWLNEVARKYPSVPWTPGSTRNWLKPSSAGHSTASKAHAV